MVRVDWWANRFWDDPKLREEEAVNPDFEAEVAAMEAEMLARQAQREAEAAAAPPPDAGPADPGDWEDVP